MGSPSRLATEGAHRYVANYVGQSVSGPGRLQGLFGDHCGGAALPQQKLSDQQMDDYLGVLGRPWKEVPPGRRRTS
jgi:hypothetical protein